MGKTYSIDENRVDRVVRFVENLRHTKGRWKGTPFHLLDWEYKIVRDVFGTVDESGIRKYRTVYIELPKKQGKSPFASALAAYLLSADGEPSPEVYSCAVDKTQAGIIYKYVSGMTMQFPALRKKLRYTDSQKLIRNNANDGEFQSLSADVPNKHGITPSAVIFDELHAQPSREFHDVMTTGVFAAREQPLLIYITTAGNDPDRTSICWEVRQRAIRVLNGESNEKDLYACIYGLGEDRDWTDSEYWKQEENWYKANPSLGETIKIEDMRADFAKTIGNATNEELFKQLRLNIWTVQRRTTWLPLSAWDKGNIPFDIAKLKKRKCYGGLDIASTMDLSAFVLLFPEAGDDGRDIVLAFFWIPEESMFERIKRDRIPYGEWVKEGLITATPGNVIDQDYIEKEIIALSKIYQIEEIGYDRHDTSMLVTHLLNSGITMVPVNQSIGQLSPAIKATEIAIMENKIQHGGNKVLRWNFRNIVVYRDVNENIKLNKVGEAHRIDGIDALVDAEHRKIANWKTGKGQYYGGISSIEV